MNSINYMNNQHQQKLSSIRKDFPLLSEKIYDLDVVYLDNGATTLKPQVVVDAVNHYYTKETANIHRGIHYLSERSTEKFEASRELVQSFIGAKHLHEIIFTKGTTDGINLVASSFGEFLQENDEIVISAMEHHSNIVPWQLLGERKKTKLKVIPMNEHGELILDEFVRLLSPQVKVISLVYISNSLGTINPIQEMIRLSRKLAPQAKILVDAAQAVAHRKINVQELDCDFLVFSSHKLFGPTGVGVLYGKEDILNQMPPYQGGGDMIESVSFEKTTFNVLPYKFEAGTPPIAGVIGLAEAIKYVQKIGFEFIEKQEKDLLQYGTEVLSSIPGLKIIGTAKEKTSIISFVLDDVHPHDIGTFTDQSAIALRTGHHCTQPVMKFFKVPATARASMSFYNTREEIDALKVSLLKIKEFFA